MPTKGRGLCFGGNENVPKLIVMKDALACEYIKSH